jgi:hypothetical protein
MSRFILVPTMLAVTLAVTVAGCNRFPDLSIQVVANLQPSDDCTIDANQEEILFRGRYDLNVVRDYFVTPLIESYLVSNGTEIQGESQNIQINGMEITIVLPDGSIPTLAGELPNPFTVTTSATIPANEASGGVSKGAAAAIAIPASYHSALLAIVADTGFNSIQLDIRANGTTSGGFSQQSAPFRWPVEFCQGCLGIECEEPAKLGDSDGCFPGQDSYQYCAVIVPATP